jgi:hypothetical protein
LFYSIEPTKFSDTDGRYLLITHKDNIAEAEQFIDFALKHLTTTCPDSMAKITHSQAPVTRANRISTSDCFQSYVSKLQGMVPSSISLSMPIENVWKCRTPTTVNLTDDHFPALVTSKKPRTDLAAAPDTTTATDTTKSLTMIDMDEIERTQNDMKEILHQEIATLCEETRQMQETLQHQFNNTMTNLEIWLEKNTQTMFHELGHSLHQAVETMNAQAALADTLLKRFKDEATQQHASLLQLISNQISALRPTKRNRDNSNWAEVEDAEDASMNGDPYDGINFGDHPLTGQQLWTHTDPQATQKTDKN